MISKHIVSKAKGTGWGIAPENLKRFRRANGWSSSEGTIWEMGLWALDKANRTAQTHLSCLQCDHTMNAGENTSRNIGSREKINPTVSVWIECLETPALQRILWSGGVLMKRLSFQKEFCQGYRTHTISPSEDAHLTGGFFVPTTKRR